MQATFWLLLGMNRFLDTEYARKYIDKKEKVLYNCICK